MARTMRRLIRRFRQTLPPMTDFERIQNHFNALATCKRRRDAKPQLGYLPGCAFIECEHEKCACRMNDGDGGPLSEFIARWNARHGMN